MLLKYGAGDEYGLTISVQCITDESKPAACCLVALCCPVPDDHNVLDL